MNGLGSFVETITAIDAMTLDNGPIRVIPGSHLSGHLPVGSDGKPFPVLQLIVTAQSLLYSIPAMSSFLGRIQFMGAPQTTVALHDVFFSTDLPCRGQTNVNIHGWVRAA